MKFEEDPKIKASPTSVFLILPVPRISYPKSPWEITYLTFKYQFKYHCLHASLSALLGHSKLSEDFLSGKIPGSPGVSPVD